ncbi:DNA-binding response regulator [Lacihabitans sp. LS3-19]|uniref:LytR/AlgR family response regulator transcription factor n=1 Tax=Lacihabitans sp. LS3-19 TaxID=2487335 RepID=UPI0020CC1890|nr:LytTR family DNA-binding domain-containing protein [Lacihabitans sp. LS3-19]MCP9770539.1 DNA-binding response regulator [Lacihabitans sp. LS3-19]
MNSKIRCIAVDDEMLGRKLLEENISQLPFLELVGTCKNAFEAIELLQTEKIDLVFLDIQMPGMTGTQLLESLTIKPMVIFVTAYEQYAVESYDLQVIDYLMKPVSLERFTKAALKAREFYKLLKSEDKIEEQTYMFVNVEYSLVKINFDQIIHIEGLKDYIKIYVTNAVHPILTKSTLKGIEEKLPSKKFLRVQKSFIVNLEKIESIRNHRITIGKFEIPVSDSNMESLLEAINYNK